MKMLKLHKTVGCKVLNKCLPSDETILPIVILLLVAENFEEYQCTLKEEIPMVANPVEFDQSGKMSINICTHSLDENVAAEKHTGQLLKFTILKSQDFRDLEEGMKEMKMQLHPSPLIQETNRKLEIVISSLNAAKKTDLVPRFSSVAQPATAIYEAGQTLVFQERQCLLNQIIMLTKPKEKQRTSYDRCVAENKPSNLLVGIIVGKGSDKNLDVGVRCRNGFNEKLIGGDRPILGYFMDLADTTGLDERKFLTASSLGFCSNVTLQLLLGGIGPSRPATLGQREFHKRTLSSVRGAEGDQNFIMAIILEEFNRGNIEEEEAVERKRQIQSYSYS
ncbi:hypothetical protein RND71_036790 [Anisodus tanguticus]|uniref:Uncharacterized protein n=1 Tax=Anisodus tanguticus TaxID=243964 RepID=A0AAE1R2B6_9SOLA|nr:hypothetical protein RND71_036790 [Anisodus tanguticus]